MTGPTRPVALPAPATRLAPTLQAFFTERLIHQRNASTHTIAAYRDTWRLLLTYLRDQHTITASEVSFTDLGADIIAGFLDHLRHTRGNTDRTSNARLAAIRSLFTYAAPRHPEHADLIARVLAISPRTTHRPVIDYLTVAEADALLAAPDRTTWIGRRDHLLILILLTTGLRVSELTGLTRADIFPGHGAHLACHGKGRKDRVTPISTDTVAAITLWTTENPAPPTAPLLSPHSTVRRMSTDAVEARLTTHAATAARHCPSLTTKIITPHLLRHTTAMRMLASGIDIATIALWLGHETTESTRAYLHADLQLKQRALDRTAAPGTTPGRYQPPDTLLAFLERL
jgi:site-specific recombinase XerD